MNSNTTVTASDSSKHTLQAGDTAVIPDDFGYNKHLYLVLFDPFGPEQNTVIVNITKLNPRSDTTVILRPGHHNYIVKPSAVFYKRARILKVSDLQEMFEQEGEIQDRLKPYVLKMAQKGLFRSKFTNEKLKRICREERLDCL